MTGAWPGTTLAASAALVVWLGWRSLGWPLIHDAPLMHYIAWLLAEGAVPYRDAFDMNLPGVYLVHLAAWALGGASDLGWRLWDLAWLALGAGLIAGFVRPAVGGPAAAQVALLFALCHLAGGAWRAGQRDFVLSAFLVGAAWAVARALEGAGGLPLLWGGLALGAGMAVKPVAVAFVLGASALVAWTERRPGAASLRAVAVLLAGAAVVPMGVLGWLAWRGGLAAFLEVQAGYVLPLYSQVGRVSLWEAIGGHRHGWALLGLLGVLAALALSAGRAAGDPDRRRALASLGVGYGLLHYALQGKGWEYHLYPLLAFGTALAAWALGGAPRWRAAALVATAALVAVLGAKGAGALEADWIAAKERTVRTLVADLRPLVPAGGTAQVMDTTGGGIHALLHLGVRQPTRFIYDFHFFHHTDDARIRALRTEFAAALAAGRPAAVVVFRDDWVRPGYDRLDGWPAVATLLRERYRLAVERREYRVYAQRSDP